MKFTKSLLVSLSAIGLASACQPKTTNPEVSELQNKVSQKTLGFAIVGHSSNTILLECNTAKDFDQATVEIATSEVTDATHVAAKLKGCLVLTKKALTNVQRKALIDTVVFEETPTVARVIVNLSVSTLNGLFVHLGLQRLMKNDPSLFTQYQGDLKLFEQDIKAKLALREKLTNSAARAQLNIIKLSKEKGKRAGADKELKTAKAHLATLNRSLTDVTSDLSRLEDDFAKVLKTIKTSELSPEAKRKLAGRFGGSAALVTMGALSLHQFVLDGNRTPQALKSDLLIPGDLHTVSAEDYEAAKRILLSSIEKVSK